MSDVNIEPPKRQPQPDSQPQPVLPGRNSPRRGLGKPLRNPEGEPKTPRGPERG